MLNVLQKCEVVLYADTTLVFNISETDKERQLRLLKNSFSSGIRNRNININCDEYIYNHTLNSVQRYDVSTALTVK